MRAFSGAGSVAGAASGAGISGGASGAGAGPIVINFPTIDALAHAWDLSASVGRAIEFAPEELPAISPYL